MAYSLYSRGFRLARRVWRWGWLALGWLSLPAAAQTQPPKFSCSTGKAYLFQGNVTDVYELDLITGGQVQRTTSGIIANTKLNAFGYNQLDNYIWGAINDSNRILQLASDYTAQQFPVKDLPIESYVVGDVDKYGIFYLTKGGNIANAAIYTINLTQPPAALSAVTLTKPLSIFINDWAISPKDNNLYALSSATAASSEALMLYRISTADGTVTRLGKVASATGTGNPAIAATTFGAVFMDVSGTFYVSGNTNGYIYSINRPDQLPPSTTAVTTATFRSYGPLSSNNDGARCPSSTVTAALPLPVTLVSFAAAAAPGRTVHLAWRTASEQDNDFFEVQYSLDGSTFTALSRVAGHGTSAQAHTYAFTHANPGPAARHYYRLRQADTGGTATFSTVQVVALAGPGGAPGLAVAPNPTTAADLRVLAPYAGPASAPATLVATNLLGQVVLCQPVVLQPGTTELRPASALLPGAYWLRLTGESLPATPAVRVLVAQ